METKSNRVIISVDDLTVNDFITVHSSKLNDNCIQSMGIAFQVKAFNLPYLACQILGGPPCILDTRYVNFMRVTQEYVNALIGKPNETL